jgi:adenine/guanine phosphoribosyltransferase-like PRPP-binding protein
MNGRDDYDVEINGLRRRLPLFEVAPGTRIAVFNLLGDTEVVEAAAAGLAERLAVDADALVTAETKSVPLVYELARRLGKPWVILRAEIVAEAAVFTEGDSPAADVIALGHLPLFAD